MDSLKLEAIQTALAGNWKNAISINKELLKDNPNDIEALNRLAYAFSAMDKIKDAKTLYRLVLKLDNLNPIALRNLKRLTERNIKEKKEKGPLVLRNLDTLFLEESGKTKVIDLVNVAEPKIISFLMTGEILKLSIKRLKIFVLSNNNQYIGMLPDDIAKRLIKFLNGGNIYSASVKSVGNNHVCIFVKEAKRVSKFKNQPSFVSSTKTKLKSPKRYSLPRLEEEEEPEDLLEEES